MNIIISDSKAHTIKVFNRERQLVATIGQEGTEPGDFKNPTGIAISSQDIFLLSMGRNLIFDNSFKLAVFHFCYSY